MKTKYHEHYTSGFSQICEKGEVVDGKKKVIHQGYADNCKKPLYDYVLDYPNEYYKDSLVNWERVELYNKKNPDPMKKLREHMEKSGFRSNFEKLLRNADKNIK